MPKEWLKKCLRYGWRSTDRVGKAASPKIYSDDLFLVSYPKSGNTWMRFLLANLLRAQTSTDDAGQIDFNSAVHYVPEYELHTDAVDKAPRPRIIKSHTIYNACFPRVVYLVRDPRDVYVSYYHYLRKRLPAGMTLGAFIRMDGLHPCHWNDHVSGWLDRPNVMTIRYEDMLADTHTQLKRCVTFYGGREYSDSQIDAAVRASSFDRMKCIEQQSGRPFQSDQHAKQSTTFMRKGQSGDWVNHYQPVDLAYIHDRCGGMMKRLGYSSEGAQAKAG